MDADKRLVVAGRFSRGTVTREYFDPSLDPLGGIGFRDKAQITMSKNRDTGMYEVSEILKKGEDHLGPRSGINFRGEYGVDVDIPLQFHGIRAHYDKDGTLSGIGTQELLKQDWHFEVINPRAVSEEYRFDDLLRPAENLEISGDIDQDMIHIQSQVTEDPSVNKMRDVPVAVASDLRLGLSIPANIDIAKLNRDLRNTDLEDDPFTADPSADLVWLGRDILAVAGIKRK